MFQGLYRDSGGGGGGGVKTEPKTGSWSWCCTNGLDVGVINKFCIFNNLLIFHHDMLEGSACHFL